MRMAPVEFVMITFDGDSLSGDIAPAITDLVDRGLIRIIDLASVSKAADGSVTILEMRELSEELAAALEKLTGEIPGLMSQADLEEMAEDLAPGTTAAMILFEQLWAARFAEALRAANGELVFSERIPAAVVEAARESLLAAAE